MVFNLLSVFAVAALWLASIATAQGTCVEPDLCFALAVPDTTMLSGKGDIYFSMLGPTNYSWVSITQAWAEPHEAHYLVMYPAADGRHVTVSSRISKEADDVIDNSTQITLLADTGVADGLMYAVIKCSNCDSWNRGSAMTGTNSTSWRWAYATGGPIHSDDPAAHLPDAHTLGIMSLEPSVSSTDGTSDPFVSPPNPVSPGDDSPEPISSDDLPRTKPSHSPPARIVRMYTAHAVLACLAWAGIFPLGGILVRLLSHPNLVWLHAALQFTGYILYIAAVGLGVQLSINPRFWRMGNKHVILGLLLFVLFFLQGCTGYAHHRAFKSKGSRHFISHAHLWTGRVGILLGMLNAGFGFQITGKGGRTWQVRTYVVFAVVMFLGYVCSVVGGERRRKRTGGGVENGDGDVRGGAVSDTSSGRCSPGVKGAGVVEEEKVERSV